MEKGQIMMTYDARKGMNAVKNVVRAAAFKDLHELMVGRYGEDRVSVVGSNELAICFDTVTLADGTEGEICFTVKPVVKDFDTRKTSSGNIFDAYERLIEADSYEMETKKKAEEAEKKKAEKAKKIEKDKKKREEAKEEDK